MQQHSHLLQGKLQRALTAVQESVQYSAWASRRLLQLGLLAGLGMSAMQLQAAVLPYGEQVVAGQASFDRSVADQLTIRQTGSKLITNWDSFNISEKGRVQFIQPDTGSMALNRVTSASPTQIFGQLTANGQLVLVNPNGIVFGQGAQVNTAALTATSMSITDANFNAGNLVFNRAGATGSVENQGNLTATQGNIALLATTVKNSGTLSANAGNIVFANANQFKLGSNIADVKIASSIAGVIQQQGKLTAHTIGKMGGKILLLGDTGQAASSASVTGQFDSGAGINITASTINVGSLSVNNNLSFKANKTNINDVLDINGNDSQLAFVGNPYNAYLFGTHGRINLNGANNGFSVNGAVYTIIRNVQQLQAMEDNLNGKYVLGNDISASETTNWKTGTGTRQRGFVPVGTWQDPFTGTLDGLGHAVKNLTIWRPYDDYVGLFGMATSLNQGRFTISNIGLLGGTISGANYVGALAGSVSMVMMTNDYSSADIYGQSYVGGLIGDMDKSNLVGSYSKGDIFANGQRVVSIGGLVGSLASSGVRNSYATGNVTLTGGQDSAGGAGGLVGTFGEGGVSSSYATGNVDASAAKNSQGIGGLIGGGAWGGASNSYATGDVSGGQYVGGLIGGLGILGSLSNVYATGKVTAKQYAGGLIGYHDGTSPESFVWVKNALWDVQRSGQANAVGFMNAQFSPFQNVQGLTSRQMRNLSSYASWGSSIDAQGGTSSTWRIYNGYSLPLLRDFLTPVTATVADSSKVYDGTVYADSSYSLSSPVRLYGKVQFISDSANVGQHSLNIKGLYSTQYGYDLIVDAGTVSIQPQQLSISTVAEQKVYDGRVSALNKPIVEGLVQGDRISSLFQQYADASVGDNKTLLIKPGYVIQDGNEGHNYIVIEQGSNDGSITAH